MPYWPTDSLGWLILAALGVMIVQAFWKVLGIVLGELLLRAARSGKLAGNEASDKVLGNRRRYGKFDFHWITVIQALVGSMLEARVVLGLGHRKPGWSVLLSGADCIVVTKLFLVLMLIYIMAIPVVELMDRRLMLQVADHPDPVERRKPPFTRGALFAWILALAAGPLLAGWIEPIRYVPVMVALLAAYVVVGGLIYVMEWRAYRFRVDRDSLDLS